MAHDPFEITQQDPPPVSSQLSLESARGLSLSPPVSGAVVLSAAANQLAATLVVAWHLPKLIALYAVDWKPLAGAGVILLIGTTGARTRDIVGAIRSLRRRRE